MVAADASKGFCYCSSANERTPDPLVDILLRLRGVDTEPGLSSCMRASDLFDGLRDEREVYDTVKKWIRTIIEDTETALSAQYGHRAVPASRRNHLHPAAMGS